MPNIVTEEKLTGHRITVRGPEYNGSFWVYGQDFDMAKLRAFFEGAETAHPTPTRRRRRAETAQEPLAAGVNGD